MAGADLAPARALVYRDVPIRDRGEMLSLTDMWRAAGEPASGRPADWRRKEGADFIDFVQGTMPGGHSEVIQALNEGGQWNTWAHWQIGFAYAKYLSHEFHAFQDRRLRLPGRQPHLFG